MTMSVPPLVILMSGPAKRFVIQACPFNVSVADSSPFILPWFKTLKALHPTWEISVVIPDSQKSWISKAFHIAEKITATFYNPNTGSVSPTQQSSEDWVLLNGHLLSRLNVDCRHTINLYEYWTASRLWGGSI
jgi:hypothetical protein